MKNLLRNRRVVYIFFAGAVLLLLIIMPVVFLSAAKKELSEIKDRRDEMIFLKDELMSLKTKVNTTDRKKNLSKVNGVIPAIDELFSSLGIRGRVKSIKTTGRKDTLNGIEEEAEVSVEKLNMNEMVNLLYSIDNSPVLFVLKKVNIRTSFEKPDALNLSLTISVVHGK